MSKYEIKNTETGLTIEIEANSPGVAASLFCGILPEWTQNEFVVLGYETAKVSCVKSARVETVYEITLSK